MQPRFVRTVWFRAAVMVQGMLQTAALADLARQPKVRRGRKWMWAMIIPTFGYGGPLAYWLFARPK